MITWPVWSHIAWGICVLQASSSAIEPDYSAGIAILLVGLSIFCWILGILMLKWDSFRIKLSVILLITFGILNFFAF